MHKAGIIKGKNAIITISYYCLHIFVFSKLMKYYHDMQLHIKNVCICKAWAQKKSILGVFSCMSCTLQLIEVQLLKQISFDFQDSNEKCIIEC